MLACEAFEIQPGVCARRGDHKKVTVVSDSAQKRRSSTRQGGQYIVFDAVVIDRVGDLGELPVTQEVKTVKEGALGYY